ncbi:MAG TPA: hypothetical protein VFZ43_02680 [Anaerolineales bacterium]
MLFNYADYCFLSLILLSVLFWAISGYAYRVNAKRPDDDPTRKDFHPSAVIFAPVTWPVFIAGFISIFLIKALVYGVFLILFTIALFAFQDSVIPDWLDNILTSIGNRLLKANTLLIKIAFGEREESPQPI